MKNIFKYSLVAALTSTALTANAGIKILDNEQGHFSIGGDVELDFNYQDRDSTPGSSSEFNQDGRILIEFSGERYSQSGHFVGVNVESLFRTDGDVDVDDVYLTFGKKDGWAITAGRFEAYDMFPVGLDVFLEYSGDTSNDLYTDGSAYIYQMKEARGRGSDGQIMYNQSFGNLYLELATMIGDRSALFADSYHGVAVDKDNVKDSFLVRPVVAYQLGDFTFAASMETNLVSDAIVDINGKDISDRTGYGATVNWANANWSVNANFAYMDAVDEENMSMGLNAVYKNFGLGHVYATNDYDNRSYAVGDVNVHTTYASYEFKDVLDIEDFGIALGTYYTTVENKTDHISAFSEDDDFGARIRLTYAF